MAKQTATPAKRSSKPIKGTPRPKSSNAKTTPASIKKKPTTTPASKAKRSASKSASTRKSTANNRSVSPIKELSFTGTSTGGDQDFKTPVKPSSAVKRKLPTSSAKSNRSTAANRSTTANRSASKTSASKTTSSRPSSRASSRPATPSKAAHEAVRIDNSLADSILNLREYCSII